MLSLILMTTTVFPGIDVVVLVVVLGALLVVGLSAGGVVALVTGAGRPTPPTTPVAKAPRRETWRTPPLALLGRPVWSRGRRAAMSVLWAYLALAVVMLLVKTVQLGLGS